MNARYILVLANVSIYFYILRTLSFTFYISHPKRCFQKKSCLPESIGHQNRPDLGVMMNYPKQYTVREIPRNCRTLAFFNTLQNGENLLGGLNSFEKHARQNGFIFHGIGVKINNYLKSAPSIFMTPWCQNKNPSS